MWEHKQVAAGFTVTEPQRVWRTRTWRERLFSWPWRPWAAQEFVGDLGDLVKGAIARSGDMQKSILANNALLDRLSRENSSPTD